MTVSPAAGSGRQGDVRLEGFIERARERLADPLEADLEPRGRGVYPRVSPKISVSSAGGVTSSWS
jgi:hypothetical protein